MFHQVQIQQKRTPGKETLYRNRMKKKKERKQDKHLIQVPMEKGQPRLSQQLLTSHIIYLQMEIRTMKPPPPSPFNSIKNICKPLHIISIQGGDLIICPLEPHLNAIQKRSYLYARPEDTQA